MRLTACLARNCHDENDFILGMQHDNDVSRRHLSRNFPKRQRHCIVQCRKFCAMRRVASTLEARRARSENKYCGAAHIAIRVVHKDIIGEWGKR
ncbi:Uncharacterised protein [Bordetella pertussis]|nr:Uncharacterised protein [Bordetella pertussis]